MVKAQLKIQQMAFMLIALFIFFILVGMFYIVIQSQELRRTATQKERDDAVQIANILVNSPELSCGDYCVDADRAMVLANISSYKDFWQVNSIEIRTIFPENTKEVLCTRANYPNCNLIRIFDKGKGEGTASSFVSLCKRTKEKEYIYFKCELGRMIVGYQVKI
jgi:hypothetical protein